MGTDTRGFASIGKKRHKEVSSQGGKNANKRGLKHQWNHDAARAAGLKSAAARRVRQIQDARARLLNIGFSEDDLKLLMLTQEEYLYYAGKGSSALRRIELRERLQVIKNG